MACFCSFSILLQEIMMSEKPTILFVDDEQRILRSLKMLFKCDYNVHTTTDGNEAIEFIKNNTVHVIVSDQRMPIMLGVDLLRTVKELSPNTMRLLLTGYSDLAAIVGSVNDGEIFRYVNKPWDTDEIKTTVKKAAEIGVNLAETVPMTTKDGVTEKTSKLGLLVIDDEEETFQVVQRIIGSDHPVYHSADLEKAFSLLSTEEIAVVISEVKVAGVDITEPLKTLKQYNPNILTLVLTSFQDTKTLIDLINQGQIYRFLPKPIMQKMLERGIQSSIRHYQALQDTPQLLKRHAVERSSEGGNPNVKVSGNLMGYLKKIRSRLSTTTPA